VNNSVVEVEVASAPELVPPVNVDGVVVDVEIVFVVVPPPIFETVVGDQVFPPSIEYPAAKLTPEAAFELVADIVKLLRFKV
jgi:hypothetical protein